LDGLKFRRQHPCRGFILDFYCHEKRLAIEVDGSGHAKPEQQGYDQARTAALAEEEITVLRFWNDEVLQDLQGVVERILDAARSTSASAPPHGAQSPLQAALVRQWEENAAATGGGHPWDPPQWAEVKPKSCPLPPFKWDESRRALLRAELDSYYAALYGLKRKQLRYILDPADLTPRELKDILDPWEEVTDPFDPAGYDVLRAASDFPGETFSVLKEKEIRQHGEYRNRRRVLEAWERLSASGKLVMGFEKANHEREIHGGKSLEWKKVR
jgi:hypothetical protein